MAVEYNQTTANKFSETDASNTATPPDGAPAGIYPSSSEGIWRGLMASTQRAWDRANGNMNVGGTANAITLTTSNTTYPSSYVTGELFQFKATAANTGATTLTINSLATKNIYKKGSSGVVACVGGEIQSGDNVLVSYDGTQFQIESIHSLIPSLASPNFTGSLKLNSNPVFDEINVQVFTSSGTYTPTSGMVYCTIECWGGGGGGGGTVAGVGTCDSGGGGGAGAYSRKTVTTSTIGSSQTVTVGALGAGGTAGGNNGSNGGTSSVGSICTAGGGYGGYAGSTGTGGAGGAAGTGDITGTGDAGGTGNFASVTTVAAVSGRGGSTSVGGGGTAVFAYVQNVNGNAGTGYGSGGSGGASQNSSGTAAGGNGAKGLVIITEYISA